MGSRLITFGFAAALVTLGLVTFAAQPTGNPEASIRAFVAAVATGDAKASAAWVKGGKADAQASGFLSMFKSGQARVEIKSIRVRMRGDTAMADVKTTSSIGSSRAAQEELEVVRVDWVKSKWLLVPTPHEQRRARPGPVNSMVMLLSEGMGQIFADAKKRAQTSGALSNIKQLGLGTHIFAVDYDDKIATTPANWHKAIFPYVKNEAIFRAPGDPKKGDSFNLNPAVANLLLSRIKDPAKTVMIYQGRYRKLEFYGDGRAAVAFCDGSARLFTPAEAKKLNWKP
ncbi:MAG TPA: hypothetical protein PLX06_12905 [Fimbriimonadaceae bacterium]|nr:hypothetical protein [Fimbriimonadaceae bacterium]